MEQLRLEALSVEQKIGMTLVVRGYRDEEDRDFVYEMLRKKSIGGVQVACRPGCEEETARIRELAGYPVLICADMEKGFPASEYLIPSMMSLAAAGDEQLAYEFGCITAIEAKRHGYSVVWGPNVDLLPKDESCAGAVRRFGSDPERVSRLAEAIMRGYMDNGLFPTMKHYPGASDVCVDTHMMEGRSQLTREELFRRDLQPYLQAMRRSGLPGVMTKHTAVEAIDPDYPASLSRKVISLLRQEGFDGLITTDSFAMMGVLQKFGEEKIYGLAVAAGNDMVLPNYRIPFREAYGYMLKAYRDGVITPERLDEAVRRVLKAQEFTLRQAQRAELSEAQTDVVRQIIEKGVCALTDDGVSCALEGNKKRLFVVLYENAYRDDNGEINEITDPGAIGFADLPRIRSLIDGFFPGSEMIAINQFPSRKQVERVCYASTMAEEVVFLTYSMGGAYAAGYRLTEKIANTMLAVQPKLAAILHLGNPFAVECAPHTPRRIFAFGGTNGPELVLRVLAGTLTPQSGLPVELKEK